VSVFQLAPGLQVISSYAGRWLLKDVITGIVLTTLLVPQGMAYAGLAGCHASSCWAGFLARGR
jgi:MFS superfamily sulfate permease-like transporter